LSSHHLYYTCFPKIIEEFKTIYAVRPASRKINGRQWLPPTKWLQKCQKVRFWCIYTTPLELILSEIPEKSQCPPPLAAGRKTRWLAGKKFPPLKPLYFLPARRKKSAEGGKIL